METAPEGAAHCQTGLPDQSSSPSSSELLLDEFDDELDELLLDEFEELFEFELDELFELEFDEEFEFELLEEFELEFDDELLFEFELLLLFEFELLSPPWRHLRSDLRFLNCTSSTVSSVKDKGAVESFSGASPACAPNGKRANKVAGRISLKAFISISICRHKVTSLHPDNAAARRLIP